jgi:hypothetical protein
MSTREISKLTPEEVARRCTPPVSGQTVRRYVFAGLIPAERASSGAILLDVTAPAQISRLRASRG